MSITANPQFADLQFDEKKKNRIRRMKTDKHGWDVIKNAVNFYSYSIFERAKCNATLKTTDDLFNFYIGMIAGMLDEAIKRARYEEWTKEIIKQFEWEKELELKHNGGVVRDYSKGYFKPRNDPRKNCHKFDDLW